MQYHLAVDIGASSGRHILGHVDKGNIVIEEIYRFDNIQRHINGHDCWDVDTLWGNILEGLKTCKAAGKTPSTMGIDTWAVDFVLVDEQGVPVSDAVAYRDRRTEGMRDELEPVLPFARHYAVTGIQYQPFNSVYQLAALKKEHPEQLEKAARFLMIPEYFHYKLTGVMCNEYTNATSTALVNAQTKVWDDGLIAELGLPRRIFGPLYMPGTVLGGFTEELKNKLGFDCTVLLPATHDTGSAFLVVPAKDDRAVYISSGTWSLLGVENSEPITTPESMRENFTNEGGYAYRFRYLKNIMGLWMIQSIRRELNGMEYVQGKQVHLCAEGNQLHLTAEHQWSYTELEAEARKASGFPSLVDVNDPLFLSPDSMIDAVKDACAKSGQPVPQTAGELMRCVYVSLAEGYRKAVDGLSALTGKTYTSINIVGGGSKDGYLNELTAGATGLPVYAGPTEGTALGNIMVQMIAAGEYKDLAAAREAIRKSFTIQEVMP